MTIGKVIANYTPKKKKDSPKSIHLVGTDTPEVMQKTLGEINFLPLPLRL